MWLELFAVGSLILLNGFFACAELAIIKTRRSRIKQLAEEGNLSARLVHGFQEDSERFLATIQIGITLAGRDHIRCLLEGGPAEAGAGILDRLHALVGGEDPVADAQPETGPTRTIVQQTFRIHFPPRSWG